jgi:hypothetical protein
VEQEQAAAQKAGLNKEQLQQQQDVMARLVGWQQALALQDSCSSRM